jgi:Fe-S cluster assembly protein SufD
MTLSAAILTRDPDLLPSRRDEDWRWTGLRELIRAVPPPSPVGRPVAWNSPFADLADMTLGTTNGFGATDLNIEPGERRFVARRFLAVSAESSHANALFVSVGAGAVLTLVESYEGHAGGYLRGTAVEIVLEPGARVERIVLGDDGEDSVSVSTAKVTMGEGARFHQTVLTTGARRQRFETRVVHPGQGAEVRLDGAYVLSGKRHADQTTVVDHNGPGGITTQLTKGVAADQARGVFQGRIVVARGADGTDARMAHHALLLSDRAEIDAKPELEIYADDVACAHGNTVGALDEAAIFYARSRGIPEAEAKVMLTAAFLGEVVERIEHTAARAVAHAWLADKLAGLV